MFLRGAFVVLVLLSAMASSHAQESHDWAYLEGTWRFESSNGYEANVDYEIVAGGAAAIGKWTDDSGGATIETLGWRPDQKAMISTGFGNDKKFWRYQFTDISKNECKGSALFIDPNGTVIRGTVSLNKSKPGLVTGRLDGKTESGEEVSVTVKFTREAQK